MKKLYLQVDEITHIITGIYTKLLYSGLFLYEAADDEEINVGEDKFINGILVKDTAAHEERKRIAELCAQIALLKQKLAETDYLAIKFAEGDLTAEDFAPIKMQRHAWREEISRLEALI